jgi:hypothetical protein
MDDKHFPLQIFFLLALKSTHLAQHFLYQEFLKLGGGDLGCFYEGYIYFEQNMDAR